MTILRLSLTTGKNRKHKRIKTRREKGGKQNGRDDGKIGHSYRSGCQKKTGRRRRVFSIKLLAMINKKDILVKSEICRKVEFCPASFEDVCLGDLLLNVSFMIHNYFLLLHSPS